MPTMNVHEQIDSLTQEGHKSLSEGRLDEACLFFDKAASLSTTLDERFTERACYFNLGACCVAQGDAKKGLEYLKKALPPDKDTDGTANYADLNYNLGLAYEVLGQFDSSVECYEVALREYKTQDNQELQAETLNKLAVACTTTGELSKAANYYGNAGDVYKSLGDKANEVFALTSRANLLGEIRDIDNCAETLRAVIAICEELTDQTLQGKVYNDLGLLYNRLKSYNNAAECFEIAIPLISGCEHEKQLEAVLRQNLGAVYNQIKKYEKAVEQHEIAIRLHGELGNRSAEGQAACNMGFAYSQLRQFDEAIDKFLLAIQASKDTNDHCSHWQANEGLAAVYFLKSNHIKAVEHYKTALSSLSSSGALTTEHNDRIVNKLADAMKFLYLQSDFKTEQKKKRSFKHKNTKKNSVESDEGSTNVGKTRPRGHSHHKLIARGIDGQLEEDTESETEDSSRGESTDSDEDMNSGKRGRHVRQSWQQKKAERNLQVNSNPQLLLSGPYQNLIKRRSRDTSSDGYEEPVEDKVNNVSKEESDFSPGMPRAHREAYLASIAAATSTPKKSASPVQDDSQSSFERKPTNQSKMCVIQ